MARPFSLYSGPLADQISNVGIADFLPNRELLPSRNSASNRPKSAPRRPTSAHSSSRQSGANKNKFVKQTLVRHNDVDPDDFWRSLNREDLLFELQETKKKLFAAESQVIRLRTENQRWEKEISKQQQRIDKLLELNNANAAAGGGDRTSSAHRKDAEKGLLVRQLKIQIQGLRESLSMKDTEIENLNRSQKATHLLELITEKDEYLHEITRLQKVVKDLKDEISTLKQRREWSANLTNPKPENDMHVKQEMLRLSNGYHNILTTINNNSNNNNNKNSPNSQQGITYVEDNKRPTGPGGTNAAKSNKQPTPINNNDTFENIIEKAPNLPKPSNRVPHKTDRNEIQQLSGTDFNNVSNSMNNFKSAPSKSFNRENAEDYNSKPKAHGVDVNNNGRSTADAIGPVPTSPLSPNPSDKGGEMSLSDFIKRLEEPIIVPAKSNNNVIDDSYINSCIYKVGEIIEGHFRGTEGWYAGTITAIRGPDIYDIEYEDGDREQNVPLTNIRKALNTSHDNSMNNNLKLNMNDTSVVLAAAGYKTGDAVEARYYNGTSWYKGTIGACRVIPGSGGKYAYDVNYDDGEREKNLTEDKLRRVGIAGTDDSIISVITNNVNNEQPVLVQSPNTGDVDNIKGQGRDQDQDSEHDDADAERERQAQSKIEFRKEVEREKVRMQDIEREQEREKEKERRYRLKLEQEKQMQEVERQRERELEEQARKERELAEREQREKELDKQRRELEKEKEREREKEKERFKLQQEREIELEREIERDRLTELENLDKEKEKEVRTKESTKATDEVKKTLLASTGLSDFLDGLSDDDDDVDLGKLDAGRMVYMKEEEEEDGEGDVDADQQYDNDDDYADDFDT